MKNAKVLYITLTSIIANCTLSEVYAESYIDFEKRTRSKVYTLKQGDTISEALWDNNYKSLYGQFGDVKKVLHQNGISKDKVKKLPVGTQIYLPYTSEQQRKPASVPKPVFIEEKIVKQEKKQDAKTSITVLPSLSSAHISSKDSISNASASLSSNIGYGVSASFKRVWDDQKKWSIEAVGSYQQFTFSAPSGSSLVTDQISKTYFGVALHYTLSQQHQFGISLGQGQSLILVSESQSILKIDPLTNIAISTSGSHYLTSFNQFNLSGIWRLGVLMPAQGDDYEADLGKFVHVGANASRKINNMIYLVGIGYTQRQVDTNVTSQESIEYSLNFGVSRGF